jgi:phosphatidylglycerophosphate synthase
MIGAYLRSCARARDSVPPAKAAAERATDPVVHWLYRPLSFAVTPLFLALRISADGATLLSIGVAAALPVAAWAGGGAALAAAALLFQVLDCVDGNVARVTRERSGIGDFLDGVASHLFWVAAFVAVGVLAQAEGTGWIGRHGREIGLGIAALMLWQRRTEDRYEAAFRERVEFAPEVPMGAGGPALGTVCRTLEHLVILAGPPVAAALGGVHWLLAGMAIYQTGATAWWLARFGRDAARRRAATRTVG